MSISADPIERRDPWRTIWQVVASDATWIALGLIVAFGVPAVLVLPQAPVGGAADPIAYSQWQAQARLREGAFYDVITSLGLNNVFQTAWWRIALVLLAVFTVVRLVDRVARLVTMRTSANRLRDELRVRVTEQSPSLNELATRLRARRYRIVNSEKEEWLQADRAPSAEILSLLLHIGILVMIAGILLNLALGWETLNRSIVPGVPNVIHGNTTVALSTTDTNPGQVAVSLTPDDRHVQLGAVALNLKRVTPGYRVSAMTPGGEPLPIQSSNFAPPSNDVLLTFTPDEPERYVAVPKARLSLTLRVGETPDQPGRLQAFLGPTGVMLTDTLIQPSVVISDTRFQFEPAAGAVIDAHYRPGDPLLWLGAALAVAGAIGALIYPMRRILVRHHGHWTEFYASGRGVRRVMMKLLEK